MRGSLLPPLLAAAALAAAPAAAATVHLKGGADLETSFDAKTHVATVALTRSGTLEESISLGNALAPEAAVATKLCGDCPASYFVRVPQQGASNGAVTGIVVWSHGTAPAWSLSLLPFDRIKLVKASAAGVSAIENGASQSRYWFRDGLLVPSALGSQPNTRN